MSSLPVEFSTPRALTTPRDPYRDRKAPWSEDAETAVLGAVLLDRDALARVQDLLEDSMFFREAHRRVWGAVRGVIEKGGVADPVTIADELERRGELTAGLGPDYLRFLADAVPTAANVEYHARIIREKALLRRLIEVSTDIVGEAFEARLPASDLVEEAERRIFAVGQIKQNTEFHRLKPLLWPAMERIEALGSRETLVTGVPSGFTKLDEMTSGFQPSDLVIVAARPSMGKTAFVLNIACNAAITTRDYDGAGVAIFSLEMSKESLVQRMLTAEAHVDAQQLRQGRLRDVDYRLLADAAGKLQGAPIYIDDTPGISLQEMRSKARRLSLEAQKEGTPIKLIIVDYLQLMTGPPGVENRQQEVSFISRGLKALAKELSVPVIALSQLSRAPEQRSGDEKGRPQLSDLRESGAIEQDADLILFIFRQEVYAERDEGGRLKNPAIEGVAEIIVGKQRNGPTGTALIGFEKRYTRFGDLSHRAPPEGGAPGFGGPKLMRGADGGRALPPG
jgi:replicative DNA helicase